ncbi:MULTISPECIES: hypothetical protein [unclassified Rhodococcus (in: high G+C Gram-positive bacteria)]|nr:MULTISPECIES: hypothetical protein [unclassified Rhodococcus (in: high G+C Gram-positive bacteria)]
MARTTDARGRIALSDNPLNNGSWVRLSSTPQSPIRIPSRPVNDAVPRS